MSAVLTSVDPENLRKPLISGFTRRLAALPSLHAGAAVLAVLLGGLLLSIATTRDPLWWQLHFSQLGIFGDFSSAMFNSTLKVSGSMVVALAIFVRRDIVRLGGNHVRRGSATLACICLNVVGINLALVGCVPLNTDKDLHDRVAALMVLGFLVLVASAPVMLRRLGTRMSISTVIALIWLAASITLFVTATINLALFETISCSAMFAWTGMLTHTLGVAVGSARTGTDRAAHHLARGARRRAPQISSNRRRPVAVRMPRRSNRVRPGSAAPTAGSVRPTPPRRLPRGPHAGATPSTTSGRTGAWFARANATGPARRSNPRRLGADARRRAAAASTASPGSAPLRRRRALRARAISAVRGTRDGSPDAHRRLRALPRRRRRAHLGARVDARSLPR